MAITEENSPLIPLGRYRHYKGQFYEVQGQARHSETQEWMVFYRCLYGDFSYWVRPLSMFLEEIDYEGMRQPRFALMEAVLAEKD